MKHWELAFRRWHLGRWCEGAPCRRTGKGPHPISIWRVRRG